MSRKRRVGTGKMDEQYMNIRHKQACMDLEKATQCITQALQQVNEQFGYVNHKQACMDLEQATERIIRALQHEVGRNQELCVLIGHLEEREAEIGRSLTKQMEANKQLKMRIDVLQKHLDEKHKSLTEANQTVTLLKNEVRDLHHRLLRLQTNRTVQELNEGPQSGEKQLKLHLSILPNGHKPQATKCSEQGCQLLHCPFCPLYTGDYSKVETHLQSHLKTVVQHGDFVIYTCKLGCRKESHYHCCACSTLFPRKNQLLRHLSTCYPQPIEGRRPQ